MSVLAYVGPCVEGRVRASRREHGAGAMGTLALYVLVSGVIQNCYLRSSQCNAELDGEVNPWGEGVGNIPASLASLLQLRRANTRGEGLSAKVPLVKASEVVHTEGTSSPARPGPGPGSEAGLEEHDIPVVVGVSVSLALIFISMGVYSFRQKTENAKGDGTSSPKSSKSRRRRNYLEVDGVYENRAFQVECAVDAVEQNPYETSTSPSLLDSGPMLPAQAAGHQKEPPGVAAGEALQTAQPRAVDSPGSMQQESARQERHPGPPTAAPSAAPVLSKSARPGKPSAWAPGTCSATSPALQHIGATLYFHGPEPRLWSIVPLGRDASGHRGQGSAGPAPAGGMEACSPPGEQSSSGTAMMSVTVDIHLYPCTPEISAPAAAQPVSDSSHPEAAGAASQQPASLLDPGPRSFL
ncbi:uncharacterized protein [Emydura macquarii macquarii]|uniref:uncharacterized protein n=1 Tax=Emydura macquarii macquarii TaxID=1129001 RepID=UPI00352AF5CD